ncbi:MAG: DNA-3-methyladenine glycosylase [Chitinispirillaceae bacterium]
MFDRSFFEKSPAEVARALLGARLFHDSSSGFLQGYIIETEAYGDETDSASHARFGWTRRTEPLFGPAGLAYVYLVYGIHSMLNIVTGKEGQAGAVLIRAVFDPHTQRLHDGPGRVCRNLSITRELNKSDMTRGEPLGIGQGYVPEDHTILKGKRIGVGYAQKSDREAQLRYRITDIAPLVRYIQGEKYVTGEEYCR